MIEIFKGWVSAMLCVGIFMAFIQLIIPKTNLKKYIYSLIGIVTIITMVSPVINLLKNQDVEESVSQVIANISNESEESNINTEEYQEKNEETLRQTFAQNMKNDIKSKLEEKGVVVRTIDMFLTEQYNVEKLEICIDKINTEQASLDNVTSVVKYINEQYDLDFSKIEVIEEGE